MIKTSRVVTLNHSVDKVVGNVSLDEDIENILTEGGTFILSASVMIKGSDGKKIIVAVNLTSMQDKEVNVELEKGQIFKHS